MNALCAALCRQVALAAVLTGNDLTAQERILREAADGKRIAVTLASEQDKAVIAYPLCEVLLDFAHSSEFVATLAATRTEFRYIGRISTFERFSTGFSSTPARISCCPDDSGLIGSQRRDVAVGSQRAFRCCWLRMVSC